MILKGLSAAVCRSLFIFLLVVSASKVFPYGGSWIGSSAASSANLQITLRDGVTGNRISGTVAVAGNDSTDTFATDDAGRGGFRLVGGRNDLHVSAPGYNALDTYFEGGQPMLDVTVWLDPVVIPGEMRRETVASRLRAGATLIHGHVIDDESGKPLAGARVYLANAKVEAMSDARGYFQMNVPTPAVDPAGDLPGADDLIVEVGGKVIYRRNNILLPDGAVHFIIDADRTNAVVKDATHTLVRSHAEVGRGDSETQGRRDVRTGSAVSSGDWVPEDRRGDREPGGRRDVITVADTPLSSSAVTVPTSIRVGFTCPTSTTCSTVQVYALDTYVRLGLDDEWISSWNTNSLKAGAIAFRSYGVYYVFHPKTAAYDICSTTSCQVIDPNDSAASVDTATAQTAGSIVTDAAGANPFFAEYAAENNANLCPDGMTGNNGTWPCMSDIVDAGQTFNGHGRGMCQWGTQRWSVNQGKDFVWIVNHYYNDNGTGTGLRTGVLQSGPNSVLPPPALNGPGVDNTAPGSTVTTLTPTFTWQPVAGSDGYGLYISKFNGSTYDLVFNSETAVGQPITGTTYTLPAGILQTNAQYRWNMTSHNIAGYGTANTFRTYFQVAATVTVSGRVNTSDGVTGLRNATVSITDSAGNVRTATTSSFGFYSFDNLTAGGTYTIRVSSRRFRYQSQPVQPSGDLANVDFVGLE